MTQMTADDVVLIDLESGEVVTEPGVTDPAHPRRPSTDTPTHLALYNAFDRIGGIVHTHSTWATAWAQAEQEIPLLGTTHADLMAEAVPLTRPLTADEVDRDYEGETGTVLIELIGERGRRASRGARARPRAVLLGGDSRRGGHGGGHARGGGPAGAAHPVAAAPTAARSPTCCATSTTSASTGPAPTTARAERGRYQRSWTCSRMSAVVDVAHAGELLRTQRRQVGGGRRWRRPARRCARQG